MRFKVTIYQDRLSKIIGRDLEYWEVLKLLGDDEVTNNIPDRIVINETHESKRERSGK